MTLATSSDLTARITPWTLADLRQLAALGTPVDERDHNWVAGDADPSELEQAWIESAALGNRVAFDALMARRGVSVPEQVARWCRSRLRDDAPLPDWVAQLVASLQAAGLLGPDADAAHPLPSAITTLAQAELAAITPALALHGLGEAALSACGELLQQRFALLIQPILNAEARRASEQQTGFALFPKPPALLAMLLRYPVLAECLARTIRCWVVFLHEFAERWQRDRLQLAEMFNHGQPFDQVVALRAEAADLHDGGRQVLLVTVNGGLQLVYKPRSLAVDVAFDALLSWLREQEPDCTLRVARPLDRGDYGWCAFIDHQPLADALNDDPDAHASAAQGYYTQCGYLLALGYAINATDLHCENLIVNSGAPVPIDLETVIAPGHAPDQITLQSTDLAADHPALRQLLLNNVFTTCLLPHWLTVAGRWAEIGGFSGDSIASTTAIPPHRLTALPIGQEFARHADALLTGFERLYRVLLELAPRLLADDGTLLAAFRSVPLRFLHRDTAIYAALIRSSLAPAHLTDAARRAVYLERVYRAAFDHPQALLALMDAERDALLALDIPRFGIAADSLTVVDQVAERATLPDWKSAVVKIRDRLTALSTHDLQRQLQLIRLAVLARVRTSDANIDDAINAPADAAENVAATSPVIDTAACLPLVVERAQALFETGIEDGDSRYWSSIRELVIDGAYGVEPVAFSLANGALGFAQLQAVLARLDPSADWSQRLTVTCQPLLAAPDDARQPAPFRKRQIDVGLVDGVGGLVAGLAALVGQCGDADVSARALRAASAQALTHLDQDALRDDHRVDLREGRAGALLGLLALRQALTATTLDAPVIDGVRIDADWCLDQALAHGRRLADEASAVTLSARMTQLQATLQQARAGHWGPVQRGPAGVLLAILHLHAALGERALWLTDLAEQLAASLPRVSDMGNRQQRPPTLAEWMVHQSAAQSGLIAADDASAEQFADWLRARVRFGEREVSLARGRAGVIVCLQAMMAAAPHRDVAAAIASQQQQLLHSMIVRSAQPRITETRCISLFHGETGVALCLLDAARSGAMQWFFPPRRER